MKLNKIVLPLWEISLVTFLGKKRENKKKGKKKVKKKREQKSLHMILISIFIRTSTLFETKS